MRAPTTISRLSCMQQHSTTRRSRLAAAGLVRLAVPLGTHDHRAVSGARDRCTGRSDSVAMADAAQCDWRGRCHAGHPDGRRDVGVPVRWTLWPEQRLGVVRGPCCRHGRVRDSLGTCGSPPVDVAAGAAHRCSGVRFGDGDRHGCRCGVGLLMVCAFARPLPRMFVAAIGPDDTGLPKGRSPR